MERRIWRSEEVGRTRGNNQREPKCPPGCSETRPDLTDDERQANAEPEEAPRPGFHCQAHERLVEVFVGVRPRRLPQSLSFSKSSTPETVSRSVYDLTQNLGPMHIHSAGIEVHATGKSRMNENKLSIFIAQSIRLPWRLPEVRVNICPFQTTHQN